MTKWPWMNDKTELYRRYYTNIYLTVSHSMDLPVYLILARGSSTVFVRSRLSHVGFVRHRGYIPFNPISTVLHKEGQQSFHHSIWSWPMTTGRDGW
jgi:hypothetical protein